MVLISL